MKNSKTKGVIEEKISSKLNEIIQEFKIEKGRSITKILDESAKKIAKAITKKIKKAAKDNVSAEKDDAPMPVKAKVKTNGTPVTKPELKNTKSLSSSKPSIRKENTTTSTKNQPQSKNRTGLLKKSKEKAIL